MYDVWYLSIYIYIYKGVCVYVCRMQVCMTLTAPYLPLLSSITKSNPADTRRIVALPLLHSNGRYQESSIGCRSAKKRERRRKEWREDAIALLLHALLLMTWPMVRRLLVFSILSDGRTFADDPLSISSGRRRYQHLQWYPSYCYWQCI